MLCRWSVRSAPWSAVAQLPHCRFALPSVPREATAPPQSKAGCARSFGTKAVLTALLIGITYNATLSSLSARAAGLPVLTQAAQIRKLTPEEARRGYPVHLRAVVTYFDADGQDLFVQDSTAGVWVDVRKIHASLRAGQLLDLRGTASAEGFAPFVGDPQWRVIGEAPMPRASHVSYAEMATSQDDSLWVEVEGIVRSSRHDSVPNTWVMDVATMGGRLEAHLPGPAGPPPSSLVDAKVRLRGVCGALFNKRNQLIGALLYVPSLRQVSVIDATPAEPFSAPTVPIAQVGRFSPKGTESHRMKVRGTVTFYVPGGRLFVKDETGVLSVGTADRVSVRPGDVVEVIGFPSTGGFTPVLENAHFRKVGRAPTPAPVLITAEQALTGDYDAELVQIDGTLQEDEPDATAHTLILRARNVVFGAAVDRTAIYKDRWFALAAGSQLRLKGICSVKVDENGNPTAFSILLQSPHDITVLAKPSWWIGTRIAGLLVVLAGILLASALWVAVLRRRVDEQTATLRATLESTADGILVVNSSGLVVAYNRKFVEIWGLPESVLKSRHHSIALKFVASQLRNPEAFVARVQEIYSDHEAQTDDVVELKDGRAFERHSEPQRVKGKNTGRVWGYRDITQRRRAEETLRLTQFSVDHAGSAIFWSEPNGRILYANEAASASLGYSRQELLSMNVLDIDPSFVPDDWAASWESLKRSGSLTFESRHRTKEGQLFPVEITANYLEFDGKGFNSTSVRDITERKRAEAELHHSRQMLQLVLDNIPQRVFWKDRNSVYLGCNRAFASDAGLQSPAEVMGKNDFELPWRETAELYRADDKLVMEQESPKINFEEPQSRPDGSRVWLRTSKLPLRDREGKVIGVIGTYEDITEGKRMEDALIEERQLLRTIMDNVPDVIYFKDRESRFTRINSAHARRFGLSDPAQALGKKDSDFFSGEHAQQALADEQEIIRTGRPLLAKEEKETWPDGHETWVLTTKMPRRDANGNIIGTFGLSVDITDRKRAEKQLEERTAYLNALVENSPLGIVVVDPDDRVQLCNPAFEQLFRYRRVEIVGSNINDLVAPPDQRQQAYEYTGQVAEGEHVHGTAVRRRSDGSLVDVEIYGVPLKMGEQFVGSFGLYQDITERKRAEKELKKAKEAAEAGSRAKSEFLANMSHEIRTPMNGVLGMVELALDTDLTPEQRDYLGMVKSSADALLTVLNDVLDFSKIEAGKLDLDPIAFKLRDHLAQSMKPLALRAHQKGLELTYDIRREVPDEVVADPSRLRQIIINLTGNAIKFTERGEVGIEVGVESQGPDRAELHFQVRDTGIGIAREKQAVIFTAFAQADGSTARKFGGTGLGLTISSRLVEMMDGRIWLESELGKGSCFHFTIPVGVAQAAAAPEPVEQSRLSGLRVLVVDDNPTNRRILGEMLERWRMKPVLAENGAQALATLRQAEESAAPFALLLADVNMPEMDGFTLVERIRRHEDLRQTTIMMLTSVGQRGDAARCRALGIAAYLIKPIGQSQLLDAILSVLGTRAQAANDPRLSLITRHSLREGQRKMRVLLAEDNAVNQKLASRLLEKRGHTVVVAGNGRQALEALERQPFDLVLMDVSMPEMDGLEATRAIRAAEKTTGAHVPIIAMTAHAMKGDRERCLDAGMDGYVSKPVQAQELFDAAEAVVHVRGILTC